MFYEPEDDIRMFSGDCFVSKPAAEGAYTLGKCGGRHAVGKPLGRSSQFVVGRPCARSAQFLLGRPPAKSGAEPVEGGVYVLQKADGDYYVGKSGNVQERLKQHAEGTGAACAKGKCKRVPTITPACDDLEAWERSEVLARMRRHGIQRVRGWMYTNRELSEAQAEHAFSQVCEKYDLCRRCGGRGHFAKECKANAGSSARPAWAC